MKIALAGLIGLAGALCTGTAIAQNADRAETARQEIKQAPRWALAIHGGAGTISREKMDAQKEAAYRAALQQALDAGAAILKQGGPAGDAVQAVITRLEDDEKFNAGRGSVFTWDGTNEMDAAFMDGASRTAGAVAGVTRVKNPILLARAIMEDGRHVFLSGKGAEEFASDHAVEMVDPSYFAVPERLEQLEKLKDKTLSAREMDDKYADHKFGTVGAVALDMQGHLAAGTSTGGTTGKRWGRIGDSPVIGAGTYADDRACAVSATGTGEYFIRVGVAKAICDQILLAGKSTADAAQDVIREVTEIGGDGGVIVVSPDAEAVFSFNTSGMYRGRATSAGISEVAIFKE
ncbi:MAG: isoaspartyl peptidase/L-asparaginase family protein [Sphingomonadaceae bacterium]